MALFKKGQSGNPSGSNSKTRAAAQRAEALAQITAGLPGHIAKLQRLANAGDIEAAKLLMSFALPTAKPTRLPAPVDVPNDGTPAARAKAVVDQALAGELATDVALEHVALIHQQHEIEVLDALRAEFGDLA